MRRNEAFETDAVQRVRPIILACILGVHAPSVLAQRVGFIPIPPGQRIVHHYITEAGDRAGGIYLWESKAAAEACYTREWQAMVTDKYGAPPGSSENKKFSCILRDSGGTGFWHEAYFMSGHMEAVYDDMVKDTGFLCFAPVHAAKDSMFTARGRAKRPGEPKASVVLEDDLYS